MTAKQTAIVATWNSLDDDDDNLSTESLFERVAAIHKCDVDTVAEALEAEKGES